MEIGLKVWNRLTPPALATNFFLKYTQSQPTFFFEMHAKTFLTFLLEPLAYF